ncbi:MAG: MlaD family protein [Calditrichaceae bacterium]|jgi:phospholipid/cholesterol/gamma-HCH transport system substrate-binding protein
MKTEFTTEFKVGLTVIIATFILIFGIIWGKGFKLQTNKYQLSILFENVGGLVPGDPVMVNGVKEGKVLGMGWQDRQVLVHIELDGEVKLYKDATFTITSLELLTGMKIEVNPGTANEALNLSQQPIQGKYGGQVVDIGLTINDLAKDVNALTLRLDTTIIMINRLLGTGTLQEDIKSTLLNLNRLSVELKDLPVDLDNTLSNLNNAVDSFRKVVKNNEEGIFSTLNNIKQISSRLDTVATSVKSVIAKIENKEGTLGKMVYDPALYENLNRALISIDSLAKKLEKDGLDIDLF